MIHTFTALGQYLVADVNSGAVHVLDRMSYDLLSLLEGEEKILLLRLLNAENEISSTIALENFILGFRLGMRIAMESLGEDAGSLTMYREEG